MRRMDNIMVKNNDWDLVIKSNNRWLDLKFAELWYYRELIFLFAKRDFVATYKQTILGPIWFFIQPLVSTVVFSIIFGKIAKIPTNNIPHYLFYLSGIIFWSFFSDCLTQTSSTFSANAGIFGKVYFPRLIVPLTIVINSLVKLLIQIILFLSFLIYYLSQGMELNSNYYLFLLPVLLLQTAMLGLGFGLVISSLTTKYRDLSMLVSFGVTLWMYATPVVYPLSEVPTSLLSLYRMNPLVGIITNFRYAVWGVGQPESMFFSWVFTFIILFLGIIVFTKVEKTFMDTV